MSAFEILKIHSAEEKSVVCDEILRSLPDWFGIESAIHNYVIDVKTMDTWVARIDGLPIGFIAVKKHNQFTAEIHVMGILKNYHRQDIGTQMMTVAEEALKKEQFVFLSVKTLSESHPDLHYAKTRAFYLRNGFLPIEEFKTLWGEANPCLLLMKSLK